MRQRVRWLTGVGLLTLLVVLLSGHFTENPRQLSGEWSRFVALQPVQAQGTPESSSNMESSADDSPEISVPEIASQYNDGAGRFQIGILADYQVSAVGNTPLFESPEGRLAYTAIAVPASGVATDNALIQAATELFQRGESFQITETRAVGRGLYLDWLGSLTIGGQTQPMQGVIVARQSGRIQNNTIVVLLIAATDLGAEQLPSITDVLVDSLEIS